MNIGRGIKYFALTLGIMYIGNLIAPAYFQPFSGNALYLIIGGALLVALVATFKKQKYEFYCISCEQKLGTSTNPQAAFSDHVCS